MEFKNRENKTWYRTLMFYCFEKDMNIVLIVNYWTEAIMLSSFFLRITKPSITGESGIYSSVASSALSPNDNRTGVVWVCDPAIVLGVPAFPMTSTAWN